MMIAAGKRELAKASGAPKSKNGSQSSNDRAAFHFSMPGQGSKIYLNKSSCVLW